MKHLSVVLVGLIAILSLGVASPSFQSHQLQATSADYDAPYNRWCRAIDSYPALGESFWITTSGGPADLRDAVAEMLSIGPNLTPFLAEKMRGEKNNRRIYQLVLLLLRVSGINLYFNTGEDNTYAAMPRFRDSFIEAWDSGKYLSATDQLRATWTYDDESEIGKSIDAKRLTPLLRFGVFALPFIIESLERRNSPELFAAFLLITGEEELPIHYMRNPSEYFRDRAQKSARVAEWVAKNERKFDRLTVLSMQLKSATGR